MTHASAPRAWGRRGSTSAVAALAAAALVACGSGPAGDDDSLQVYAQFAPLVWVAEQVGGSGVEVTSLTPAGADPHSVELSPATVAQVQSGDLVVYLSGFQASADEAVAGVDTDVVVDTAAAAQADVESELDPPDPSLDPHFWLDPVRLGLAVEQVADAYGRIDPDGASGYSDRAAEVVADLEQLDTDYATALQACAGDTVVTSHEAFGFLAARYGLQQQGITGIDPEVEPSPARLRDVAEVIESTGVRTIYFETATSPRLAEQLASDLGVQTGVLNTMESPTEPDYLVAMRTNLDALTDGLVCEG